MSVYKKLTPNLLVANVEQSLSFYVTVLGFTQGMTVPDASPYAFASATSGPVEVFFNEATQAVKDYPAFGGRPLGLTGTLFIEVAGVDALHNRLRETVPIVMPIVTQWYGVREFAVSDPDGYVITFAERTAS